MGTTDWPFQSPSDEIQASWRRAITDVEQEGKSEPTASAVCCSFSPSIYLLFLLWASLKVIFSLYFLYTQPFNWFYLQYLKRFTVPVPCCICFFLVAALLLFFLFAHICCWFEQVAVTRTLIQFCQEVATCDRRTRPQDFHFLFMNYLICLTQKKAETDVLYVKTYVSVFHTVRNQTHSSSVSPLIPGFN